MVDRNSPIEPNRRVEKIKPLVRGNFYTLNLNSTTFQYIPTSVRSGLPRGLQSIARMASELFTTKPAFS